MVGGQRAGRRLLAVVAVLCAIAGLLLAAGAMAPIASESPASDVFGGGDEAGERTASEVEGQPMAADETVDPSAADGGGSGSGAGTGLGGMLADSELVDAQSLAGNPLLGGALGELLGLSADPSQFGGNGESEPSEEDPSAEPDSTDGEQGSDTGGTDDSGGDDPSTTEDEFGGTDSQAVGDQSTANADSVDGMDADGGQQGDETGEADGEDEDDSSLEESVPGLSDGTMMAALAGFALLVIGYVFYARDDPIGTLLSIPGRIVSLAMGVVVACSGALERAVAALRGLTSIAELPGLVLAAIADALTSTRTRVRDIGSSVSISLFGGDGSATDADGVEEHTTARERIRTAFETVIEASPMYRDRVATATPADVARSATDAGAPDEPVETITDSFRDVEYGDRDPDAYLERTAGAHERLRAAVASTDDESASESEDGADE